MRDRIPYYYGDLRPLFEAPKRTGMIVVPLVTVAVLLPYIVFVVAIAWASFLEHEDTTAWSCLFFAAVLFAIVVFPAVYLVRRAFAFRRTLYDRHPWLDLTESVVVLALINSYCLAQMIEAGLQSDWFTFALYSVSPVLSLCLILYALPLLIPDRVRRWCGSRV